MLGEQDAALLPVLVDDVQVKEASQQAKTKPNTDSDEGQTRLSGAETKGFIDGRQCFREKINQCN